MKNKVLLCLIGFMFVFLVVGLGSALLCIGSDGYYYDCSDKGDNYRKLPKKTAVQNYNKGYYEGEYEGRKSGYKKGYGQGYDKGYEERREDELERRKRESSSWNNYYKPWLRTTTYVSYPSYSYSRPSYSYNYGSGYYGSGYYGYGYNSFGYGQYNSFGYGGLGGYGYYGY